MTKGKILKLKILKSRMSESYCVVLGKKMSVKTSSSVGFPRNE